jgi:hypothetical protein
MPTNLWTSANEFRHQDRLQAIALAERNSQSQNPRKSITVQHFSDNGTPDSPAELVVCQAGHSPIAMKAINGGYYVATENDPDAVVQQPQRQQGQFQPQYQNQ